MASRPTTPPLNRAERRRKRAPQRYVPSLGSVEDAAEFYGVNPRTVRRMIHDGKLKAFRVGARGLLRVDMNEVYDSAQPVPPESVAC